MRRKVVKHGSSTLTISLPSSWVKKNKIEQGDELNVLEGPTSITFSNVVIKKESKEISVNIDGHSYLSLARLMYLLYRSNYDKITLIYSKNEIDNPGEKKAVNIKSTISKIISRFIGAEIIAQSSTKTEIKIFLAEENPNLEKIESRIYFLLKETLSEFIDSLAGDFKTFNETVYDHHDNITKFINYYLRVLYTTTFSEEEKKIYYSFYSMLDNLIDKIRHLSNRIAIYGTTKKVSKFLKQLFDLFIGEFEQVRRGKLSQKLISTRYRLKEYVEKEKFSEKELKIIKEIYTILDTTNDFTEIILARAIL